MTGIRVEGLDNLVRSLDAAKEQIADTLPLHQRIGQIYLTAAHRIVPRKTGRLDASQAVQATAAKVTVTATVRYAAPVHKLRPWLRKAAQDAEPAVIDAATQHVTETVNNIRGA